jgi:hypothetical protein
MITFSWTEAPAGLPAEGLAVRPRCERRAPEAFTAPYQGTGLPFGGSVVDTVVTPTAMQLPTTGGIATDKFHNDATTLGIHSSRRPPG